MRGSFFDLTDFRSFQFYLKFAIMQMNRIEVKVPKVVVAAAVGGDDG